jgi:hypothetical protein
MGLKPKLTVFSPEEIEIIDRVIKDFDELNNLDGETSFMYEGWKLAEIGEEIPYGIALWRRPRDDEITEEIRAYAKSLEPIAREFLGK